MPTVPRLSEPQVQQAALPGARVNVDAPIEAFGGGTGTARMFGALNDVGENLSKQAALERKEANEIEALSHDSEASKIQTDLENKARLLKGKDAGGALDMVQEEWKKSTDELLKSAANDEQRRLLTRALTVRGSNLYKTVSTHTAAEIDRHQDDVFATAVKTAQDEAVSNFDNPDRISQSLYQQQQAIMRQADRKGLDPQEREAALLDASTKTHMGVIARFQAQGADLKAKEWYQNHSEQIAGGYKDDIEKSLRIGSVRGESQRIADSIFSGAKSETEALAKVKDSTTDPEVRDATRSRVKEMFSDKAQAIRTDQDTLFQDSWNKVSKAKSLDAVTPDVLAKLRPDQQKALGAALHMRETNLEKYYEFQKMASDPDRRQEFLKLGFSDLAPHLSEADMKTVGGWQAGLMKQDGKTASELDGIQSNSQIRDSMMAAAGIDPTPKSENASKMAEAARVKNLVDIQIAQRFQGTGKKPTNKDVREVMDDVLKQVITSRGYIFDSKARVDQLKPGQDFEIDFKDIPATEIKKMDAVFGKGSEADYVRRYKAKLKKLVDSNQ